MPPDTKPESEQDWRRQSSVKLHWIAGFYLFFPFTWVWCHHVPPWSSNKAPLHTRVLGSCKAGSMGHLGSGNPPGATGVGLLRHILLPSQPRSTTTMPHFILSATAFPSRGIVEQDNREPGSCCWVSSPWRTSEAQGMWHHSAPSTIHVDLIAGARDVSPGPGLLEVTSHGAQELNWHQAGSAHQKLRDIFHKWPLIHLPFQECSSSSNLQALKGHDLGHSRLFVLNLMVPWQSHFYFPFHWAAVQTHIQGMVIWIHTFLTQPLTGAKQAPADSGSPNLAPNPAAPALSSHYPI